METDAQESHIDIGMPLYNAERYLAETLDTVLSQTHSNFTLYISDNASTDTTQAICLDYAARDERIVYHRNEINLGAAGNYEKCFSMGKSKYFRWQNGDDPIEATLLEKCVHALDKNPSAVLAYGRSEIIDKNGNKIKEYSDNLHLVQEDVCARFQACLEQIGLQNLMYGAIRRDPLSHSARMKGYVAADINLIGELSLYGQFIEIPEHLFNRRMHPEASSWDRTNAERQRNFWDPSKRKLIMQSWRSSYEYFKAVYRSPIPFLKKLKLTNFLVRHTYWRKDRLAKELKEFIRFGILKLN